ncbi:hypothetical protein TCAL_14918 [Tigriopus californicus]|uniref:JmjC domain-containing protein n=1 Tax=Tigriopus californicus TaxID=6832 RepID=A0A553N8Q3_TIGCA|nr:bifunctional peptidase and arginyl-hydroxylase JMJD5-like [Tigriopus californicus]TRY61818.1 hypothetical protein TCAL_14918 [Tigriopus californicus]
MADDDKSLSQTRDLLSRLDASVLRDCCPPLVALDSVEARLIGRLLHAFIAATRDDPGAGPASASASSWIGSYPALGALHDRIWEKLNTGHWSAVALTWRQFYALVSLLKLKYLLALTTRCAADERWAVWPDLIKICDMGSLMGYPLADHLLNRLAAQLARMLWHGPPASKRALHTNFTPLASRKIRAQGRAQALPVKQDLSILTFVSQYRIPARSVLLVGAMADWPAMTPGPHQWTLAYLRRVAGYRTVPVELGSKYTDPDWTQTLMTVNQFLDEYVLTPKPPQPRGYLAQHPLLEQIPELSADILIPDYCYTGENEDADGVDINVWFGPRDTISPLHTDPKHNMLCQVMGRKYIRIYHADQTPRLYPHADFLLSNTSRIDLERPDFDSFPLFKEAEGFECVLEPGDMVYIPPGCWHFVQSLSTPSLSLSFWFN